MSSNWGVAAGQFLQQGYGAQRKFGHNLKDAIDGVIRGYELGRKLKEDKDKDKLKDDLAAVDKEQPVEEVKPEAARQAIDYAKASQSDDVKNAPVPDNGGPTAEELYKKAAEDVLGKQESQQYKFMGQTYDLPVSQDQMDTARLKKRAEIYRNAGKDEEADRLLGQADTRALTAQTRQLNDAKLADVKRAETLIAEQAGIDQREQAELAALPGAVRQGRQDATVQEYQAAAQAQPAGSPQRQAYEQAAAIQQATPVDQDYLNIPGAYRAAAKGLALTPEIQWKYANERAASLTMAGRFDEAKAAKAEAKGALANGLVSAVLSRDGEAAKRLYNQFPNGDTINDVSFDKNGRVTIKRDSGEVTISQEDALVEIIKNTDPKTAMSIYLAAKKSDAASELGFAKMEHQLKLMGIENAAKMAVLEWKLQHGGVGGKGGAGKTDDSVKFGTDMESGLDIRAVPIYDDDGRLVGYQRVPLMQMTPSDRARLAARAAAAAEQAPAASPETPKNTPEASKTAPESGRPLFDREPNGAVQLLTPWNRLMEERRRMQEEANNAG